MWERKQFTFDVGNNWVINSPCIDLDENEHTSYLAIYLYGTAGDEGIIWYDDVQLEIVENDGDISVFRNRFISGML